jgi:hypothetical protein
MLPPTGDMRTFTGLYSTARGGPFSPKNKAYSGGGPKQAALFYSDLGFTRLKQAILCPHFPVVLRIRMEPMFEALVATAVVFLLGLVAYLVYLMSGAVRR